MDATLVDVLKKVGVKRGERLELNDYIFMQYTGGNVDEIMASELAYGNTFFID